MLNARTALTAIALVYAALVILPPSPGPNQGATFVLRLPVLGALEKDSPDGSANQEVFGSGATFGEGSALS